ncbi:zinc finger, CCHC-type containing protein [Tanacetum coccineum]
MHFLLTTLKVVYVLSTPAPEYVEEETLEQKRKRCKWDNDDYICRGHILNGMSDALFDVYQNVESKKELWDQLEAKYMAEDTSSKKFLVSNFNNYIMVYSSMVEDDKNKKNNKNSKGNKRKFHDKKDDSNKKSKMGCWKCGKHGHFKKDCRVMKNNGVSAFGSDDEIAWWIDSGVTCHACEDHCWFDTFHLVEDGSVLHMGNESTKPILGHEIPKDIVSNSSGTQDGNLPCETLIEILEPQRSNRARIIRANPYTPNNNEFLPLAADWQHQTNERGGLKREDRLCCVFLSCGGHLPYRPLDEKISLSSTSERKELPHFSFPPPSAASEMKLNGKVSERAPAPPNTPPTHRGSGIGYALSSNETTALSEQKGVLVLDNINRSVDIVWVEKCMITLGTFDVVVGMDWLVNQDAVIICGKKVVHIPVKNKTLEIVGDRGTSRLKIISCIKASKYIERGHQLFVAHVTEKEPKEKRLEDVPVIRDFPEVFPDDLPGLPPPRQVEFKIELVRVAALLHRPVTPDWHHPSEGTRDSYKKLSEKFALSPSSIVSRPPCRARPPPPHPSTATLFVTEPLRQTDYIIQALISS